MNGDACASLGANPAGPRFGRPSRRAPCQSGRAQGFSSLDLGRVSPGSIGLARPRAERQRHPWLAIIRLGGRLSASAANELSRPQRKTDSAGLEAAWIAPWIGGFACSPIITAQPREPVTPSIGGNRSPQSLSQIQNLVLDLGVHASRDGTIRAERALLVIG